MGISEVTMSPDPGASPLAGTTNITELTAGGTTYGGLVGGSGIDGSFYAWVDDGTNDPGSTQAAFEGLTISEMVANSGSWTSQFGQSLDGFDVLALIEYGGSDVTTLQLVDADGNSLGDAVSIASGDYGVGLLPADTTYQRSDATTKQITGNVGGVAIPLTDFNSDLTQATGVKVSGNAGLDPVLVAVGLVPEPTSLALLAIGGLAALRRRRN